MAGDDVSMNAISEVETDRESTRIRIGNVVGSEGRPAPFGESHGYKE